MVATVVADLLELSLPFDPRSAGQARQRLSAWLIGKDVSDATEDNARLVVSELVGNAVRHALPLAGGTLLVGLRRLGSDLEISVADGGASSSVPLVVDAQISDVAGRGMAIVEALASRWWVDNSSARLTVHALVPGEPG